MYKFRVAIEGVLCAAIGIFITLLIELALILAGREMSMVLFPVLAAAISGLLFFSSFRSVAKFFAVLISLCGTVLVSAAVLCGNAERFQADSVYQNADAGAGVKIFFADQKIMLIVPHQDDELNVLGGTIEEFVRYGSEVYVVYLTNGDMTLAETRFSEAISCLSKQGIPEDHVIFMGYGDRWQEDSPHPYNAEPGQIVQSRAGFFTTYGAAGHPPYREGADYTMDNLLADMESVILEYRPDVIFACDYDEHVEHKATSLVFEKVMGRILKNTEDYRPRVFKGYANRTAWNGVHDYYGLNIASTQRAYYKDFAPEVEYYRWEDRIRFPVDASGLSRSLLGSKAYDLLATHFSQQAVRKGQGIINGDKVFWERHTSSLCNQAEIRVTSGNPGLLTDFMLLENNNIVDDDNLPYDGVWVPELSDPEKKISVILPELSDLDDLVFYDHPSPDHNVLEMRITFDNGEQITVGPLDPIGAPTTVAVNQKQSSSFEVELTVTEGERAGLTELEAFAGPRDYPKGFIQLTDTDGEFVYDYITDPSGEITLHLYHFGNVPEIKPEHYSISVDNERCLVEWSEQGIIATCPRGEAATVSVISAEGDIWDRAYIRNPGKLDRLQVKACQLVELFSLDHPENVERDRFLQQFVLHRFQTKLWNFCYRLTH